MTRIAFNQAWVTRATSQSFSDDFAVGRDLSPMPSEADVAAVVEEMTGTDALREIMRRNWLGQTPNVRRGAAALSALREFLFAARPNKSSLAAAALFRRQQREHDLIDEIATLAWLCRVTDQASDTAVPAFDIQTIDTTSISRLVRLSARSTGPRDAIRLLHKWGIQVVIESSLPGMRVDGASFLISDRPVIAMTLRYDRLDNFWFTLLHEVAHIVLHLINSSHRVFVDAIEDEQEEMSSSEIEAEANAYAKDAFVPRDAWLRSEAFRFGTEASVLALARRFEIHPAVVAGRLRFERRKFTAFAHLLGAGEVRSALLGG